MTARPVPVVLDVDTGVDDACALLLAACHPRLELRAVSCVAGNTDVDQVVRNTLTVLDVAGAGDVPVARGAERALLEDHRGARHAHGNDGMGDLGWPVPAGAHAAPQEAVELLREVLLDAADTGAPVTLVTLAPLTNIAVLLRAFPEVAAGIERLVLMGDPAGLGNATAAAEFNMWHDPEAAAVVLSACANLGIAATMYGQDVFYESRITTAEADRLRAGPVGSVGRLAGELIAFQARRLGADRATIGDAGAVCAVVDPTGLTTRSLPVRAPSGGDRIAVATAVDGERYRRLWLETMGAVEATASGG